MIFSLFSAMPTRMTKPLRMLGGKSCRWSFCGSGTPGRTGSLKSLHLFMALRGLPLAVRFNADAHSVTQVHVQTTSGRPARYTLLSLPFYLCDQVRRLVDEARDPHAAAGHGRRDQ